MDHGVSAVNGGDSVSILRRTAAIAGTVAIALPAAACTSESPSRESQGSTAQAEPFGESRQCRARQGEMIFFLRARIQDLTSQVLSRPGEMQNDTAVRLRRALRQIERRSQKACGDGRTPLVPLIELAYSRDDHAIDEPLLRGIVAAFEEWGRAVGKPRDAQVVYHADPCVPMRDKVHASYVIHRQPESGGTRVWVVVELASEWHERIYMEHAGSIKVTGARPDGATERYGWGGSSADTAGARPGRTAMDIAWPAPLPDPYIHLLSGGTAHVFNVYAWAYGSVGFCRIPIPRATTSD